MKRRIIKQGHNTLTMTLPAEWVKKHGICPGDEIELIEQGKNLLVKTDKGPCLSTITIDISGLTPLMIWRYVLSVYRAGYDEIRVTGIGRSKKNIISPFSHKAGFDYLSNKKASMISPTDVIIFSTSSTMRTSFNLEGMNPVETITACVNRLINVELIEQKEDYCVIKELGETTYKEFDNAVRRIFLLLKLEAEHVSNAIKGRRNNVKYIHIIDTNLDRFEDFCLRVLNKRGYSEFRKTPMIYATIMILEMIGDELKKIGMHLLDMKKINLNLVSKLFDFQVDQLNRLYDLFYQFEKKKAVEIYEQDKIGTDLIDKNYKRLSGEEKELLHHFKKIGIFVLNLTELRIDLEA